MFVTILGWFFSKIGSIWRKSPCSTFCYYPQVMLISKLRHSYHYKKLWAWRIPWNPVGIAQVSYESLMTASFPKCRKRTEQSRIIMRSVVLCTIRINKTKNNTTNKNKPKKTLQSKIPSRRFLGVSFNYNLREDAGSVSALGLQVYYAFFLLSPTSFCLPSSHASRPRQQVTQGTAL